MEFRLNIIRLDGRIVIIARGTPNDAGDIYHSNYLFMNDLYIYPSQEDGWTYLVDRSNSTAGPLDDYGYDRITDLMEGRTATIRMKDIKTYYSEYDFNI